MYVSLIFKVNVHWKLQKYNLTKKHRKIIKCYKNSLILEIPQCCIQYVIHIKYYGSFQLTNTYHKYTLACYIPVYYCVVYSCCKMFLAKFKKQYVDINFWLNVSYISFFFRNGVNVEGATHKQVVDLIKSGGDVLTLTVISVTQQVSIEPYINRSNISFKILKFFMLLSSVCSYFDCTNGK